MNFIKKYFAWIVLVTLALGIVWPMPGMYIKPFNVYILMVMMFFGCLKINLRELRMIKIDWWRYGIIVGLNFIWPVLATWLIQSFFTKEIFVGLIIAAAVPSAVSVVLLSDLLGGEPTKALVATTLAHLFSPLLTPFLVWFVTRQIIDVSFIDLFWLITKTVIIPLFLAQIVRQFTWQKYFVSRAQIIGILLLMFLNLGIVAPTSAIILGNPGLVLKISLVVTIFFLISILFSIWFGRSRSEDITWSIIGSYKNVGLASVIVSSILPPVALIGTIAYSIVSNLAIVGLQCWQTKSKTM